MQGTVVWYHEELRLALIERPDGFTVGSVESGELEHGLLVCGSLRTTGLSHLTVPLTGTSVAFNVEADVPTEGEASELLGFVRD